MIFIYKLICNSNKKVYVGQTNDPSGRPSHRKGKSISESHRRRIAVARMGTTHSEETKNKMSIAQKERWARSKNER